MEDIRRFEPFWDNWYITEELGEGGFGKVYKVERKEFGNIYTAALKHIRVPQSQSEVKSIMTEGADEVSVIRYFESAVKDIVGEFVLMSKLKGNSHIVSYEDHKVIKSDKEISWDIFIRMELLTNLIDYIRENEIVKKDIIKLGIDMCKALELCQKYNIVHRDIKPENIFISENGDFKLGDFGIARQVERTMSGLSQKGTFTYIAPEVYKGEAYGSSVDIYSLGLVMYRLLNNNRMPFMPPYPQPITHRDRESAMLKRLAGTPLVCPANDDGRLAEIILKACSYDSNLRYSSPHIMRMELEDIMYSDRERRLIYPNGDLARYESLHYVDNCPHKSKKDNIKDKLSSAPDPNSETVTMASAEMSAIHKEKVSEMTMTLPQSKMPSIKYETHDNEALQVSVAALSAKSTKSSATPDTAHAAVAQEAVEKSIHSEHNFSGSIKGGFEKVEIKNTFDWDKHFKTDGIPINEIPKSYIDSIIFFGIGIILLFIIIGASVLNSYNKISENQTQDETLDRAELLNPSESCYDVLLNNCTGIYTMDSASELYIIDQEADGSFSVIRSNGGWKCKKITINTNSKPADFPITISDGLKLEYFIPDDGILLTIKCTDIYGNIGYITVDGLIDEMTFYYPMLNNLQNKDWYREIYNGVEFYEIENIRDRDALNNTYDASYEGSLLTWVEGIKSFAYYKAKTSPTTDRTLLFEGYELKTADM